MEPIKKIHGKVLPLPRANVDTDQIIPAKYLKRIERTGFGEFAFDEWRKDPNFALNDRRYDGAQILVTGPNFGCGSSREHAPWALQQMGLKAIIAPSNDAHRHDGGAQHGDEEYRQQAVDHLR